MRSAPQATSHGSRRRRLRQALALAVALLVPAVAAQPAVAGPVLDVKHFTPSQVAPGATFTYATIIQNVGDADMVDPLEVTVELPPSFELTNTSPGGFMWTCDGATGTVHCTYDPTVFGPLPVAAVFLFGGGINLPLRVDPAAAEGPVEITTSVAGGGAPPVPEHTERIDVRSARAPFEIVSFSNRLLDADGSASSRAAAHPDALETTVNFSTRTNGAGQTVVGESVKEIAVELPPGLIGNPLNIPRCTEAQLQQISPAAMGNCPPETQVGTIELYVGDGILRTAVFNMVPPEGVPARFGFQLISKSVHLDASLRNGSDYGLTVTLRNIDQTLGVTGSRLTMWGRPTDPSHDFLRGDCGAMTVLGWPGVGCPNPGDATPRAFLANPTSCGPIVTRVTAVSWRGTRSTATYENADDGGNPQPVTGCDAVPFSSGISVQPTVRAAVEPTGLVVDLSVPQPDDPTGLVTSHLRKAVVTLPEGMSVSPSSADGLAGCAPSQVTLSSAADPTCPDASRLGTVTIDTPLLDKPMEGSIFLARPHDNPFGTLLSIYLVAKGPGVIVKLPGRIATDPVTGRVTASFDDNPQLPFSHLRLRFDSGPRAALVTPATCGEKTVTAQLTPWSGGAPVTTTDRFEIAWDRSGSPCPATAPFAPAFVAGTRTAVAGKDAPFLIRLSRQDREQTLSTIDVGMPAGLLGRVGSVPLCPDAAAATGTCDESSRVGSAVAAAGPGPSPLHLPGRVYLTGSYSGAPYGLAIVVPAVAGPFDLGTVVVRASVDVDRETTALRVVSDPMPTILQGIPLQVRGVTVTVDRPGFMFNATSCRAAAVTGRIGSTQGAVASVSSRYRLSGCAALRYAPRLSMQVGARGRTRRGVTTPLAVTLRMPPGQANNRFVQVTLPEALNSRLEVIRRACSLEQFQAGSRACTAVGRATAVTPLLSDPLTGSASFVRNPARRLPDLMVRLRGQGTARLVEIVLTARIRIPPDLTLRATFDTIPDAPIRTFTLRIGAGRNGSIGLVENVCNARARRALKAAVAFRSQGGQQLSRYQRVTVAGCARRGSRAARRR